MIPKRVKLSKVLDYFRGITFKPSDVVDNFSEDSCVCMRTKNIQKFIALEDLISVPHKFVKRDEQYLKKGDLLISSANSWNLVGKVVQVPELGYPATAGGFISILRPKLEVINPDYLFRFISSDETQHNIRYLGNQTTNISNLDRKRFLELEIPLPPLKTQKKIAEILQQGDTLRQQAKQMQTELDQLAQAIFIDMFGDPVTNPKKYKSVSLKNIVDSFEGGKSIVAPENESQDGYRVLKISAVTSGIFKPSESKPVPSEHEPDKSHFVKKGDLLFSRANTQELVGATALVDSDCENLLLPDKLWRFKWKDENETAIFYWRQLQQPHTRLKLSSLASGAGGAMKNIPKSKLGEFTVIQPPMDERVKFEERYQAVISQSESLKQVISEYETLFNSLMQKAFKGELVA